MTAPDIRSEFCDRVAVVTGLLSDRAAYVTSDVLVVDGGQWLGKAIYTDPTKGA
jgi:hypothetical protein